MVLSLLHHNNLRVLLDLHMRRQQATLASLQQVCQHAPGYIHHRPSPITCIHVMKHIIHRPERNQTMSIHVIVQLLSDNTRIHKIYSKMMAKNIADIHQCDRYKTRYLLAGFSITCDTAVETNSALGDYIGSSRDTFITLGQRHEIEQILSHDRHMPFTQTLFDHEPLPVTCKPLPCLMSARLQAAR
jgi:hypothetical protein